MEYTGLDVETRTLYTTTRDIVVRIRSFCLKHSSESELFILNFVSGAKELQTVWIPQQVRRAGVCEMCIEGTD
eukprot:760454-Hanusia_phi.AAC.1